MEFKTTKLNPHEAVDHMVDYYRNLYDHLRGPGHGLSEEDAVTSTLQGLADFAKKYIPIKSS